MIEAQCRFSPVIPARRHPEQAQRREGPVLLFDNSLFVAKTRTKQTVYVMGDSYETLDFSCIIDHFCYIFDWT